MHVNSKLLTRALCAAALAATAACGDNIAPRKTALQPPRFTPTILDGAHGGNKSVFFLPPMVSNPNGQPGFGAPVAAGLPVSFKIDQLPLAGCSAGVAKLFPTTAVTFDGNQYQAIWHTDDSNLNPACTYRISVLVGQQIEAFADVDVVSNGSQLKRVDTQEYVPLLDGRTLPINVRVQQGVTFCNDANCVSQVVPANGSTLVTTPDGENAVQFSNGWFDISVVGTDQVIVTVDDITSSDLALKTGCGLGVTKMVTPSTDGNPVHCVRFTTDPLVTHTTASVVAAVCQENRADIPQLLLKYDLNEAPIFLRNTASPINCPETGGGIGSRAGFGGAVRYAMSRLGHAVQSAFGPRTAYAFDLGVGGAFDGSGFSVIAAGTPVQMVAVTNTTPSATAGTQVDGSQTVQLRYLHHPNGDSPIGPNDATVTCTVVGPNGHLGDGATSAPAVHGPEDPDGNYTCPSWTLDLGDNFLQVTSTTLDAVITLGGTTPTTFQGTVTFHGTGTAPVVPQ